MALGSGPFNFDTNATARQRLTVTTTEVNKAAFWFLVIVCLTYSIFGIVMVVVAFLLRRDPDTRDQQAKLVVGLKEETPMSDILLKIDETEEDDRRSEREGREERG